MIEQAPPKLDFRCTTCGYGVARLRPPERCPMCTGSRWQRHLRGHVHAGPMFALLTTTGIHRWPQTSRS